MTDAVGDTPAQTWLRRSALLALDAAARDPADGAHAMGALIHTALMAETTLDFIGMRLDRDWSSKGRRFSKYKRLRVFRLALGFADDIKTSPWRSVVDAFDFHDLAVYGRIDAGEKAGALELAEEELAAYSIGSDWRAFCTVDNARRVFEEVDAAMTELLRAAER